MRSYIEINLKNLERNVRTIKESLPAGFSYISIVKADAYGHCMPQSLLRFLAGGADYFAVANIYEASRIRELVLDKPILVLSPILSVERNLVFEYDVTPAVSTIEECEAFNALAKAKDTKLKVHIKIDTGMGRMGVLHSEAVCFIKKVQLYDNLEIAGVFTHLSSADSNVEYTNKQLGIFRDIVLNFDRKGWLIHAHNSAGLAYLKADDVFNAVRVGLLQYGIIPNEEMLKLNVLPVMSFKAKVASVSLVEGKKLASISAGYADGVPADFAKGAVVLINGKACPILGEVFMDECYADVSQLENLKAGDEVVFIGTQGEECIDLHSYSLWTRRIPWETMVSIPTRVKRVLLCR
ncbi:MAG: alanine racemase [Opitutales bacterium]